MVLVMVRKITRMVVGFDLNLTSTSTIMASRLRTVPTTAKTLDRTPPKRKWLSGSFVNLATQQTRRNSEHCPLFKYRVTVQLFDPISLNRGPLTLTR